MDQDIIASVESGKCKSGKAQYLKYLRGGRLTRQEAIRAKCYDCDGMGDSGECVIEHCALYPYSPYRKQR